MIKAAKAILKGGGGSLFLHKISLSTLCMCYGKIKYTSNNIQEKAYSEENQKSTSW